jgi:hypothetical protein
MEIDEEEYWEAWRVYYMVIRQAKRECWEVFL